MRLLTAKDITDVDALFNSLEWDIIELDFSIDKDDLESYYTQLKTRLQNLCFSFNSKEYLRPEIYDRFQKENAVGNYQGNVQGWSVSWPIERDIPCPSKSQANIDMYPELQNLDEEKFYYDCVPMQVYKFGILNKMLEILTLQSLRQMLIALHPSGLKVNTHTDGKTRKLHVPFHTNKDAVFTFGENRERTYHMELGKGYIINTLVPHGTENNGSTERVHLLSRVDDDFMQSLLLINCNIADK